MSDKVYFVYPKPRNVNVMVTLPSDYGKLNVASYRNLNLGYVNSYEYLSLIKQLHPTILDEDTAEGFKLLIITNLETMQKRVSHFDATKNTVTVELVDLTDDEKAKVEKAVKLFKKLTIRGAIESKIGDIQDNLADLSKKVSLLEKAVMLLILDKIDEDTNIKDYFQQLYDRIQNGDYTSIFDALESVKGSDIVPYFLDVLNQRENTTAQLMKTYYENSTSQ